MASRDHSREARTQLPHSKAPLQALPATGWMGSRVGFVAAGSRSSSASLCVNKTPYACVRPCGVPERHCNESHVASRRKPLESFEFSQYRVLHLGLALSTGVDEAPIHIFCATIGSAGGRFHRSQPIGKSGSGESCRRTQQPTRFLVAVTVTSTHAGCEKELRCPKGSSHTRV